MRGSLPRQPAGTHGRNSWNSVRVAHERGKAPIDGLEALLQRWRESDDVDALRELAQTLLLVPFDLSGPRVRALFDSLRVELCRLFVSVAVGEDAPRRNAKNVLESVLLPESASRRGAPPSLGAAQRDAIAEAYLEQAAALSDEQEWRALLTKFQDEVLPHCQRTLRWPPEVSLDLEAIRRSLRRRRVRDE